MTGQETPRSRTRVLIVEDEPTVAQMLVDVLETDGHEVEVAANGLLALEKIEARAYDLIISDLRMPELDGIGLYREIKRRQPAVLARFVFVSGTADDPEYRRFLSESAVPILAKPFVLADLQQLIRRVLSTPKHGSDRT